MHTRGYVSLVLATVVALGGGEAVAQRPVHYTRAQERTRCLEQCDRFQHACVDILHRPAIECTRIDSTCRLNCNARFPPPGGAPGGEIPVAGSP